MKHLGIRWRRQKQEQEWGVRFYDGEIELCGGEADARARARRYGGEVVRRQVTPWGTVFLPGPISSIPLDTPC